MPAIEAAFPGPLAMAPVSAAYKKRLVGVTALMLLLPAIYGAIALASLFGTYWLAMPGRELFFSAVRPGYVSVVGFGAVCLAAFLFTAFLFRPFFARRERGLQAVSLDPVREPVLHALVEKIAEATGAPMPCEILVDANVNASASLTKGRVFPRPDPHHRSAAVLGLRRPFAHRCAGARTGALLAALRHARVAHGVRHQSLVLPPGARARPLGRVRRTAGRARLRALRHRRARWPGSAVTCAACCSRLWRTRPASSACRSRARWSSTPTVTRSR